MIKLLPSHRVKKLTGINYDTLGWAIDKVITENLNKHFNFTIAVHKSRIEGTSFVWLDNRRVNFTIHLDCMDVNRRYIMSSIIHEIRHILQHSFFKKHSFQAFSTYKEYYNSPEEKDARNFEKLTTSVAKIYDALEGSKNVWKKHDLGTPL